MTSSPWYLRLAWLFALVGGVLAYVIIFVVMLLTENTTLLPTVLLVGAGTVPLTVLLAAQSTRRGGLVPIPVILVTAITAGLFGVTVAGFLETIAALVLRQESILLVGVIEETSKMVVPLLVLAIAHRATRGGGIVVGIAAGTGFAVLETMGYGFNALLERGGGLGALDSTLILRAVLVPAGHVAWTGAICAALWHLVESRRRALAAVELVVTYVVAIVLHTAWDATGSAPLHVVIGVVSVAGLVILIWRAHRSYVRRIPAEQQGAGQQQGMRQQVEEQPSQPSPPAPPIPPAPPSR